jgi:hypothetical protein
MGKTSRSAKVTETHRWLGSHCHGTAI